MLEIGTAIKFLRAFPSASEPAHRAACSLCNIVGNTGHLTPGPALKEKLKRSYYPSVAPARVEEEDTTDVTTLLGNDSQPDWTRASFRGAWEWVRNGIEGRMREWGEVGVTVNDIMNLVERVRSGGAKISR